MPENSEEKDIFQAAQTAPDTSAPQADYGEETIRTLDWKEHIRLRPGMYIGKHGDGKGADEGTRVGHEDGYVASCDQRGWSGGNE